LVPGIFLELGDIPPIAAETANWARLKSLVFSQSRIREETDMLEMSDNPKASVENFLEH
jgi:hypothetical protein